MVMNGSTGKIRRRGTRAFPPHAAPTPCWATQPSTQVLRCAESMSTTLDSPLTYAPRMAGYGEERDSRERFRHMADPIKVFWQPH